MYSCSCFFAFCSFLPEGLSQGGDLFRQRQELYGDVQIGDMVSARVLKVKEDGKLDLSVRDKAYLQIATDAEEIMKLIERFGGALPFNDKASPEVIKRETGMSKNEFKRAVGNLLKNNLIKITEKGIMKISE